jgi:hypothetical protein
MALTATACDSEESAGSPPYLTRTIPLPVFTMSMLDLQEPLGHGMTLQPSHAQFIEVQQIGGSKELLPQLQTDLRIYDLFIAHTFPRA